MRYPDLEKPIPELDEALGYGAVRLFTQGARRAKQGFELTRENLSGVVRICRLVEGMPLAIRLAAAWVALLSPQEIARELAGSLDLLATDRHDAPGRQRSVRATLDHTWRLLTERERELMRGLSIFRGGFTREAAQAVVGATLRGLMALADKSLLSRTPTGRYEIHELLRQYAEEKLDATPKVAARSRDRHCTYYAAALERWGADLKGSRQIAALAETRAERGNIRASWERAVAYEQMPRLDQALEGLCRFYHWRGHYHEGVEACRAAARVLETMAGDERPRYLARILTWESAFFYPPLGCPKVASELLERCLDLLGTLDADTRAEKAAALAQKGRIALYLGDSATARRSFEESLVLCRALDDRWTEADVLVGLGHVAWRVSAYDEAKDWAEKSLAIRHPLGDIRGIGEALGLLGQVAHYSGQLEESVRVRREMVALRKQIGDRRGVAFGLFDLAASLRDCAAFAEAEASLKESRAIFEDLGYPEGVALDNAFLGWIDVQRGRYDQARVRLENGLVVLRQTSRPNFTGYALIHLGVLNLVDEDYAAAKALLKEAADIFEELGQRVDSAFAITYLGYAARAQGHAVQAHRYLHQALQTAAELCNTMPIILSIPTAALLLADAGKKERAVEIYALVSHYPFVAKSRFYEDLFGRHVAAIAATLPPDVVAAAQERGRFRDWWATAEMLAEELEGWHRTSGDGGEDGASL
jgi:tetratricopeptide (TPR) repeat protein